jgi:CheY-like chemotaxis protein
MQGAGYAAIAIQVTAEIRARRRRHRRGTAPELNGVMACSMPSPSLVVIDADDAMRALVHEWFAGAGYRVAGRAAPGLQGDADVSLVVVDLRDLATRGAATVSRVKTLFPAAAVLGLSTQVSRPPSAALREKLAPGLAALCPKPCTRAELLAAAGAALGVSNPHVAGAAMPAPRDRRQA